MSLPSSAYPGLPLGSSTKYLPGPGTHTSQTSIIASKAGIPTLTPASKDSSRPSLPTLSVVSKRTAPNAPRSRSVVSSTTLPTVGSTVLARVTRLEKARVGVVILCVDNENTISLSDAFSTTTSTSSNKPRLQSGGGDGGAQNPVEPGNVNADDLPALIRREDVRGWEIDKVVVPDMFRVGDVVRAVVISVGDQAAYYLSTARNELGVLVARSRDGNVMFPVSWKEFRDPVTGRVEGRKVAKPV